MDDWRTLAVIYHFVGEPVVFKSIELTTNGGKYKEGHLKGQK